jgi:hypothetical protein
VGEDGAVGLGLQAVQMGHSSTGQSQRYNQQYYWQLDRVNTAAVPQGQCHACCRVVAGCRHTVETRGMMSSSSNGGRDTLIFILLVYQCCDCHVPHEILHTPLSEQPVPPLASRSC